jgi:hypothetical protein
MKRTVAILGITLIVAVGVAAASAPGQSFRRSCPNPDGGNCLGRLKGGTYHTSSFHPAFTYSVPSGWGNYWDVHELFLLVPPSGNFLGVAGHVSDFIEVYRGVAAAAPGCIPNQAPGVAFTPNGIAHWLRTKKGLVTTRPISASVGGLHGLRLDIHISKTWTKTSHCSSGHPVIQLITGPPGLVHTVYPHVNIRLYLLHYQAGTLAVEIEDVHKAHPHLAAYSRLVRRIKFGK